MSHLFPVEDEQPDEFEDLPPDVVSEAQARAVQQGKEFDADALDFLAALGATVVEEHPTFENYPLDALVEGANGERFYVVAHGTPDRSDRRQAGMRREETVLKFGFRALRLHQRGCPHRLLLLTSHLPREGTKAAFYLSELNDVVLDAVAIVGDLPGQQRLRAYFTGEPPVAPLPAPWRATQLDFDWDDADA
jgi:hypothetical protein